MTSAFFFHDETSDRILVVDDTIDDVTEILTVACESFGSRGNRDADGGAA